jgi:hypothetical protein
MSARAINEIVVMAQAEMRSIRARLEVEESGREVASLQGQLCGCKLLVGHICGRFSLREQMIEDLGDVPLKVPDLDDATLTDLHADIGILREDPRWLEVLLVIKADDEESQRFLLLEAEKSRDLDLRQGQHRAEELYLRLFNSVENETKRRSDEDERRRKEPELFEAQRKAPHPSTVN